eukprot:gene257-266_t
MATFSDDGQQLETNQEIKKSPVTIITGFLGSGKTTLVNYILKEQRDKKICVVENEFGEVSIDDALVEENLSAREDIITMDNGCVCCSIRGDLVRTFGMLTERRHEFDAIILETTGLADPAPILFTFTSNSMIEDHYYVDSVVCLVDVKHISIHLDEVKPDGDVNEAEHQIAFADRILLNKLDLASAEELEEVIDRIKSLNSFAELIKTDHSRAPLDKILNLNSFSLDKVTELNPSFLDFQNEEEEEHTHSHDHAHNDGAPCNHPSHNHGHEHEGTTEDHEHGHGHDSDHHHESAAPSGGHDHNSEHEHNSDHDHKAEHDHDSSAHHAITEDHQRKKPKKHNLSLVSSVGFTVSTLLDVTLFNTFMSGLLQEKGKDLYRTKGVLAFADQGDEKFVFQGVHEQINFGPASKPWGPTEAKVSKLVFIGKGLDAEYLAENIKNCTVDPTVNSVTVHKRS